MNSSQLNSRECQLYARHIIMSQIKLSGQERLKKSKIVCVGAGGLASSTLMYLVGAGVGTIGVIDNDIVELSNLHRQVLYNMQQIGKAKSLAAVESLKKLNPECILKPYNQKLCWNNAYLLMQDYDIVIDCTDNLHSRHVISSTAKQLHKIHVYGAISTFEAHISVFNYRGGPSYNDIQQINKNTDNNCQSAGVIGVLPGLVGLIQATESIKMIIGAGNILDGYMMIYNALEMSFRKIRIREYYRSISKQVKYNNTEVEFGNKNTGEYVSVRYLHETINNKQKKVYLVDVRSKAEYTVRHLKNSISIPLHKLRKNNNLKILKQQTRQQILIIYCTSRYRSRVASSLLNKSNIYHYILQE
uniref:Molybdopterin biosynthesis protein n=1 Tax=Nemalion vermiculare TaxID=935621 RepID=UPI00257ABCBD|nr:Molybdopterin biosynthesis protein [Nemalion vermiculare]WGV34335.1 Molybdopterin biosynthesis protein [Nemalion vermiculare]